MKPELSFIGHIETPYMRIEECPNNIDPNGPLCQLVIDDDFIDGLLGLVPGQKVLILYWFEKTDREAIQQESRSTGEMVGTFALRSPHRPNPIGAAVVQIETIEKGYVTVNGLDCLNGTDLLDIKPAIMSELNS